MSCSVPLKCVASFVFRRPTPKNTFSFELIVSANLTAFSISDTLNHAVFLLGSSVTVKNPSLQFLYISSKNLIVVIIKIPPFYF